VAGRREGKGGGGEREGRGGQFGCSLSGCPRICLLRHGEARRGEARLPVDVDCEEKGRAENRVREEGTGEGSLVDPAVPFFAPWLRKASTARDVSATCSSVLTAPAGPSSGMQTKLSLLMATGSGASPVIGIEAGVGVRKDGPPFRRAHGASGENKRLRCGKLAGDSGADGGAWTQNSVRRPLVEGRVGAEGP